MELIYFLVGLIILIIIIGLLWRAGVLATTLAPLGQPWQTIVTILLLLLAAAVLWYLFGGFVHLPGRG